MAARSGTISGVLAAGLLASGPAHAALDDRLVAGGLGLSAVLGLAGLIAGLRALALLRRSRREQRRLMEMVERSLARQNHGQATQTGARFPGDQARPMIEPAQPDDIGVRATGQDNPADAGNNGGVEAAPRAETAASADEPAANVIRLSAEVARAVRPAPETAAQDAPHPFSAEAAETLRDGSFELALEPMISISRSQAVGFDVYAVTGPDDRFIYRLASEPRAGDRLAFEAALVRKAAKVARQQFGDDGEALPLYVPVSASLLQDTASLDTVIKLYAGDIATSRSLILSVPVHLMTGANRKQAPALDRLREAGARLAAEGWLGGMNALDTLKGHGVECVKISANRLLDREKLRPKDLDAESIILACGDAGITVAAMDVNTDEEAVSLIDIGVDIMSGKRFNGPRRLKPAAGLGMRAGS